MSGRDLPVTVDWALTAAAREKMLKTVEKYILSMGEEL